MKEEIIRMIITQYLLWWSYDVATTAIRNIRNR